jgi:hypothetical protein
MLGIINAIISVATAVKGLFDLFRGRPVENTKRKLEESKRREYEAKIREEEANQREREASNLKPTLIDAKEKLGQLQSRRGLLPGKQVNEIKHQRSGKRRQTDERKRSSD